MKEITLDPAEVRELLELIDKHYISDCEEATKIWRIAKREGLCLSYLGDTEGAIFRIGYIAGQRSQRRNSSDNREQRPPLITEPVSKADVKRLFNSCCKSFGYPGGAGVTLKTMTELFGKKIAKETLIKTKSPRSNEPTHAADFVTLRFNQLIPKGAMAHIRRYGRPAHDWNVFYTSGHGTMYLTNTGFKCAVLYYCNRYLNKAKREESKT